MSMSQSWWENPSNDQYRVWLIELSHNTGLSNAGVVYIATQPYISGSIIYDDWLISPPAIDERLDNPVALGEIEAYNPLNPADWLRYDFIGFSVKCYVGDTRYSKTTFDLCFSGEIESVTHDGNCLFKFAIAESVAKKMQRTNVNYALVKNKGWSENQAVTVGLGYNITPKLATGETLIYQVHSDTITRVDARYNGQSIAVIDNGLFNVGCFAINSAASGDIQCDVLANDTLNFDLAIRHLLSRVGVVNIEYVNVSDSYKQTRVGYYWAADSGVSVWDAIVLLLPSIHASLVVTPIGTVKIIQLQVNQKRRTENSDAVTAESVITSRYLTDDDIVIGSLKQSGNIPQLKSVKLGYYKNQSLSDENDGMSISSDSTQTYRDGIFTSEPKPNSGDGELIKTALLKYAIHDPYYAKSRELYYWQARMFNNHRKYTFSVGIDNTLKVGDAVILYFSELGRKFYANVVRRLTNNDGFLSSIEVILEDGEPI